MKLSCKEIISFIFFQKTIDNLRTMCYNCIVGEGLFIKKFRFFYKNLTFYKNFCIIIMKNKERSRAEMAIELVTALLLLAKYCANCDNCAGCPLEKFCGHAISEW